MRRNTKAVLLFTILSYLITWSVAFTAYVLNERDILTNDELNIWHAIAAIGPAISTIISVRYFYGTVGLKRLAARFSIKSIEKVSMLIIISPLLLFFLGLLSYPLFTGEWFSFRQTILSFHLSTANSYLGWALPFVTYAVFEEVGWRGFLLPHLQQQYSAFASSCLLAIIWAFWHTPFFFYRFSFTVFISMGFFFGLFVGSIILTSLYNSSRGCISATIAFHLLNNCASAFDKTYIVSIVSTGFVFIALYIYRRFKPENLSPIAKVMNYFVV
jgi:membrane protease YdiL (CAAX protease family)